MLFQLQGKLAEATAMYERALRGRERTLGPHHKDTLDTLAGLAMALRLQGKPEEAKVLFARAYQGFKRTLGPNHPNTTSLALFLPTFNK